MSHFLLFQEIYSILFLKQGPSEDDLEYLVGFCEGDGGFCKQQKNQKNTLDFSYRITQKSVKILKIIQHLLDFGGNIYPDPETGKKKEISRLVFGKREQVLCFLALFDGNCRFPDRYQHYIEWRALFLDQNLSLMKTRLSKLLEKKGYSTEGQPLETLFQLAQPLLQSSDDRWYQALLRVHQSKTVTKNYREIHTTSAWLSGFMEAEGCFRSQFSRRTNLKCGYSVALSIEFRQNNASEQFQPLKDRFGGNLRTEGKSTQLRISSLHSIQLLKDYFIQYPLRGRKHIAQSRWIRAYTLREQNRPLPPENTLDSRRFLRFFQSVNYVKE